MFATRDARMVGMYWRMFQGSLSCHDSGLKQTVKCFVKTERLDSHTTDGIRTDSNRGAYLNECSFS